MLHMTGGSGWVIMSHCSGELFISRLFADFLNGQRSKEYFWYEQHSFIISCL